MLAYVFWHVPSAQVDVADYERAIVRFQEALSDLAPPGLREAAVYALEGAPWIGGGARAYEDWYVVDGSASLDVLEWAAVSAHCKEAHDRVARMADAGTAGLYRLRLGSPALPARMHEAWFAKPAGWPYERLYGGLRPATEAGATVWGRQMVLGPTPEFCVHDARPLSLPKDVDARRLELSRVWPHA